MKRIESHPDVVKAQAALRAKKKCGHWRRRTKPLLKAKHDKLLKKNLVFERDGKKYKRQTLEQFCAATPAKRNAYLKAALCRVAAKHGCRLHGANNRKGKDHPSYKGKGFDRSVFTGEIAAAFDRFMTHGKALGDLDEIVAMQKAMIESIWRDLTAKELAPDYLAKLRNLKEAMLKASSRGKNGQKAFDNAFFELCRLLEQGAELNDLRVSLRSEEIVLLKTIKERWTQSKAIGALVPVEAVIGFGHYQMQLFREALHAVEQGQSAAVASSRMFRQFESFVSDGKVSEAN